MKTWGRIRRESAQFWCRSGSGYGSGSASGNPGPDRHQNDAYRRHCPESKRSENLQIKKWITRGRSFSPGIYPAKGLAGSIHGLKLWLQNINRSMLWVPYNLAIVMHLNDRVRACVTASVLSILQSRLCKSNRGCAILLTALVQFWWPRACAILVTALVQF